MRPWWDRSGQAGAELEALQTDVMRFMAILGLCLAAIFSLLRSAEVARVNPEAAEVEPVLEPAPVAPPSPEPTTVNVAAAMAQAWEKHHTTMEQRLGVLERTAVALELGNLTADLQQEGCAQAHKLAGSLGCFGFSDGSVPWL